MHDVNWWLMALSFLLGLALTFFLMIRKVTREVPVTHTVSAAVKTPEVGKIAAAGVATAAGAAAAKLTAPVEKVAAKVEKVAKVTEAKVSAKIDNVLEHDPYGEGSIRVTSRFAAPEGYTIKGDKDTGRYFTVDSPEYGDVEAEVWFANEESAQKAGFLHWAAKAGAKLKDAAVDAAKAVVHGGTSTPASAATVVTGGGAVAAAAARIVSIEEVPAGPHGKGSAKAGADGSGPAGWLIKGNADSMLYHGTDSPAYEQTIAEVWFFDEATAKAAGFDKWDKNFK